MQHKYRAWARQRQQHFTDLLGTRHLLGLVAPHGDQPAVSVFVGQRQHGLASRPAG